MLQATWRNTTIIDKCYTRGIPGIIILKNVICCCALGHLLTIQGCCTVADHVPLNMSQANIMAILQLVASLLLLNLLLLTSVGLAFVGPASMAPGLCPAVAALLHYSLLCCFTWMGLEALHLYRLLVLVYNIYMRHYLLKLSLLGWDVPALVVSIVTAVSTDFYGLNNRILWCAVRLCCGLPDSVLLFNSTIFAIVITKMLKLRSVTSPQGKRQSRNITCSVLGLTCILGGGLLLHGLHQLCHPLHLYHPQLTAGVLPVPMALR
ncbi:adhesion G protein-coupled receptor G3-like isoform X3 [Oncorhynchus keta]|uniref:adhesion G protein-coupled receptor G3-like isoform X3 n=1 Tax=Oncorhynchus keta TaxID=8018 RepID=UPI0015FBC0B6|nr:adhesion G protein-coupled receptor G3-like isoform X3 [Oncorhynchus keta]